MTLVELMVAMALGAILIGVITFVWMQSNRLFSTTINRLETYQRLRTVLDVMKRDLANTNRTVDMEFYVDSDDPVSGRPNGHYNATRLSGGIAQPADTVRTVPATGSENFRTPRDADSDPLFGKPEFGNPGELFENFPLSTLQAAAGEPAFLYAAAVLSPEPYAIGAGYTDDRMYWRDEVYVRTYAMVDGLNKPALVHYRLVQLANGRSALRRRVWFLNENNRIVYGDPNQVDTDRVSILTTGVADLKVAFYFKQNAGAVVGGSTPNGRWYHMGNKDNDWSAEAQELRDRDKERGMVSARGAAALSLQHVDQFGGANAVSFVFEGNARFENQEVGGSVLRGLRDLNGGEQLRDIGAADSDVDSLDRKAQFPGVRPGDKFYVFNAVDNDGTWADGLTAPEANEAFPDQILTVDLIFTDKSEEWAAVRFAEPLSFFQLGTSWLGSRKPGGEIALDVTGTGAAGLGPKRKVEQSFNVQYRVGFLPAAFLVRLSCDDPFNRSILQMERVIRLLEQ